MSSKRARSVSARARARYRTTLGATSTGRRVRRRIDVRTVRGRYAGYERTGGYYGRYNKKDSEELKFHDVTFSDAVIATAGAILNTGSINLIAQGTSESERIGRKCTLRAIGLRWDVSMPEQDAVATPETGDVIRMIIYEDKQANGATAAVTDILETADYQSFNNLSNSSRFRTLMDRTWAINYIALASDGAGVVSSPSHILADTFFKKCDIPLEFSATTGALTEIRSNNIGILVISRAGIGGIGGHIRLRFSDQ